MVLSWTRGRVFRRARKGKDLNCNDLEVEIAIPTHFRCPVSLDLMKDPVTISTGITYDRESIEKWIEAGNQACPVSKTALTTFDMIPNHALRRVIQDWCVEHRSYGVERIPTPRIPVTPYEVSDVCTKILSAAQQGDENKGRELVRKMKTWGKESERNRRCIVGNGASVVLASAFDSFSRGGVEKNLVVLEEILAVLTWMRPIAGEGRYLLGSSASMKAMILFMNDGESSTKQSAAQVLNELPVKALAKAEGVVEGLVKMVREPIGASASKACLSMMFHLVPSSVNKEVISRRYVELGLVPLLLEVLVHHQRTFLNTPERGRGHLNNTNVAIL